MVGLVESLFLTTLSLSMVFLLRGRLDFLRVGGLELPGLATPSLERMSFGNTGTAFIFDVILSFLGSLNFSGELSCVGGGADGGVSLKDLFGICLCNFLKPLLLLIGLLGGTEGIGSGVVSITGATEDIFCTSGASF